MEIGEKTTSYISSLIKKRDKTIQDIEMYANQHDVPIMELEGIETLLQFLRIHQSEHILEIGTAVGYSAIRMLTSVPTAHIVTIERDEQRAKIAKENIQKLSLQSRSHLIEGDALDVYNEVESKGPFDALFIDAAKGQYERFFSLYEPMVKKGGLIFSDNVLFKGMVSSELEAESRGVRAMVRKLRAYNERLMTDHRFESILLPVGDGLMISRKIEHGNKQEDGESN